jgi:DNA-binding NarL/FixJ family response regulator
VGSRTSGAHDLFYPGYVPKTVLIVDDHPSCCASVRAILEAEGFDVVGEARSGEDALASAHALEPDVILLDVQLPGMDGFAVCRALHLNGGPPAVVLVSSRDSSDFGALIQQSGARGFIPKAELSGRALADLLG